MMTLLVAATLAGASDIEEVPLQALADHAPNVVKGQVLLARPHIDGRSVSTQYKIAVYEVYRGESPEIISMWLPGGILKDRRIAETGVPTWTEGDEVVLFLREDGRVPYRGMFTLEHGVLLDASGRRGVGLKGVADPSASHTTIARN